MAIVRFVPPYNDITGTEWDEISADTILSLFKEIVNKYGEGMSFLFEPDGTISKKVVVLVNRRGIHTLDGGNTALSSETEVLLMQYLGLA